MGRQEIVSINISNNLFEKLSFWLPSGCQGLPACSGGVCPLTALLLFMNSTLVFQFLELYNNREVSCSHKTL